MARKNVAGRPNQLYYGDNLEVLRQNIKDESVDLVYLDPPFNSNRNYSVLFKEKSGDDSQAQMEAFDDTWTWSFDSEQLYMEMMQSNSTPNKVRDALEAFRRLLGDNDVLAYLVMMTARLLELHRVLKPTGSLYLHCDPTASHYLKLVLDAIFGPEHFRNEIVWRRTGSHGKVLRYGPIHDVILFYAKSESFTWNAPMKPYMKGHVEQYFEKDAKGWKTAYYGNVLTGSGTRNGESGKPWRGVDPTAKGRHWAVPGKLIAGLEDEVAGMTQHEKMDYLFEKGFIKITEGHAWPIYERYLTPEEGTPVGDIWAFQPYTEGTVFGTDEGVDADVRWLSPRDTERLGYQTQKPIALLERIIAASSNMGDVVLDPFCGCGTTVDAAQKLDRRWVGIDVTTLAVDLIDARLRHTYGERIQDQYDVLGIPRDMRGAEALFARNAFEFERWCVMMLDGQPNEKQVGDRGIDGVIRFPIDARGGSDRVLVSVKGGATNPGHLRDLVGTVESQRAAMGIFVCMNEPTKRLAEAANHSGTYNYPMNGRPYPRVQIMTVQDLLDDKKPNMPTALLPYFQAQRRDEVDEPMF